MYAQIGLMMATGLPWEYWAEQEDDVVHTALHILKQAHKGRAGRSRPDTSERGPQMSG